MRKYIFAALLLLAFSYQHSAVSAQTQKVVRLESLMGGDEDFAIAELQRVEFSGDSIRFIALDGSLTAQVNKYDYAKLLIADKEEPMGIETPSLERRPGEAIKIIRDGQVYIVLDDKVYLISGQKL